MATLEMRKRGRRAMLACASWLALTGACASSATAQTVRGRVLEEGSGAPLAGAMLILTDTAGAQVRRTLSNDEGGFLLRPPETGTYTLRVDRIGYASLTSPPLEVADETEAVYDMVVPVQAITLANIIVESESRCVLRPESGLDVSRVWEEARKALAAAAFTRETSVYRYHVMRYQRDLGPDARVVKNERQDHTDLVQQQTFVSRPVEELMAGGFMHEEETDVSFYAPDADALLSDAFLDSYCLRVREGEGDAEDLIGLAFEPVERRPGRIDIQGVLWLEPASSALQWLEFRYPDLDTDDARSPHLGGRVAFTSLSNGTWVVREWYIRMPVADVRPDPSTDDPGRFLDGIHEKGALVMRILTPGGEPVAEFETSVVEGIVVDSTYSRPLARARVFADGTGHATVTGLDGRYRLVGLTEGIHRISYRHRELEEVAYVPESMEVEVRRGEVAWLPLLAPSPQAVLRAACGEEEGFVWDAIAHLVGPTAILAGRVLDAASGTPVEGATVTAIWIGWDIDASDPGTPVNPRGEGDPAAGLTAVGEQHGQYEDVTGPDGQFLFCRVPLGPSVIVVASTPNRSSQRGTGLETAGQIEYMTVYLFN